MTDSALNDALQRAATAKCFLSPFALTSSENVVHSPFTLVVLAVFLLHLTHSRVGNAPDFLLNIPSYDNPTARIALLALIGARLPPFGSPSPWRGGMKACNDRDCNFLIFPSSVFFLHCPKIASLLSLSSIRRSPLPGRMFS